GVVWRKSSHSGDSGGNCVEVAHVDAARLVRDSKDPDGGAVRLDGRAWAALVTRIKQGGLDL
ncbi:MAG TPA: DUF397 domain-containing protein, partial [Streptosporangiaceae bacterium]